MMGLTREEAMGVLSQVPNVLRALHQENRGLQEKLAAYERGQRVDRVVSRMESGGLLDESEVPEKKAELAKMGDRALEVLDQALPAAAPQISVGVVATDMGVPNQSRSAMNRWILRGEG